MEILDLYDHRRYPTGETMVRGDPVPSGRYRCVVHICLFNSAGQLLIQQRQANAPRWPDYWDVSAASGVSSGETPQIAAIREVKEELGLDIDFSNAAPAFSVTFSEGFDDFFIITKDVAHASLRLQPEEVLGELDRISDLCLEDPEAARDSGICECGWEENIVCRVHPAGRSRFRDEECQVLPTSEL